MNNCHIFYEEDVEKMINETALTAMISPQKTFIGDMMASKVESLQALNDRIAQYNEGVRGLALLLVKTVRERAEEGEPNE